MTSPEGLYLWWPTIVTRQSSPRCGEMKWDWMTSVREEDHTQNPQASQQQAMPNPDLASLDRLVGTWEVSGDTAVVGDGAGARSSPPQAPGYASSTVRPTS